MAIHVSSTATRVTGRNRLYMVAGILPLLAACSAAGDQGSDEAGDSTAQGATSSITATLETVGTSNFVSAEDGGGGSVTANRTAASTWESFTIVDRNGGSLVSGDSVNVKASTGQYLMAANGGGAGLTANSTNTSTWETFRIVRQSGAGTIKSGDVVGLQTVVSGKWVQAANGGGGVLNATGAQMAGWEEFTIGLGGAPSDSSSSSSSSTTGGTTGGTTSTDSTAGKQKVLAYLKSISGSKAAVGIEDKNSQSPTADSDTIEGITGKKSSFWSSDWGFGSGAVPYRQNIVDEGKRQWAAGAIVQYIYHVCPLTMDEYCSWDDIGGAAPKHLSDAQWTELITPGTTLNKAWLARLDTLAPFFQQLKDAGVAPLFRVLHEMNQGAFWWGGRSGANGAAKLFQITHDYLTNTKGLTNIIWVWNVQDFTSLASDVKTYNPGSAYFDIAALDVYNTGYTAGNYNAMVGASGGKPIGIGECQFMPSAATLKGQPLWSYVALWPDFIATNKSALPALYGASNVVTLSGMPGWK